MPSAKRTPLISGNWKMHLNHFEAIQTVQKLAYLLGTEDDLSVDEDGFRRNVDHWIDDLKIDSLDFLDIAFAIDKAFGIKLPLEQWTQQINDGQATTDQYFVLKNLCARIDELIAAKNSA